MRSVDKEIVMTFAEAECLIALAQLTQDRSAHENAVLSDLLTCVTDVLCAEVADRFTEVAEDQTARSFVEDQVAKRRKDPEFMARLKARVEQDQRLLGKLARP